VRRERKEFPEAFFGDSQEEKDTVRTEAFTSQFTCVFGRMIAESRK